jgi:hypothetical protein
MDDFYAEPYIHMLTEEKEVDDHNEDKCSGVVYVFDENGDMTIKEQKCRS